MVACQDGKVRIDGEPEAWTRAPKYKRWQKGIPASISLTIYGRECSAPNPVLSSEESSSSQRVGPGDALGSLGELSSHDNIGEQGQSGAFEQSVSPRSGAVRRLMEEVVPASLEQGYPPQKIPNMARVYEPGEQEKRELGRIHQNLGASVHSCACEVSGRAKMPGPKLARPSSIHVDGDFGDVIGMNVAYWTSHVHPYHRVDIVPSSRRITAAGRTMEDQYEVLMDGWMKWAGPSQLLYLNPAGEYIGEEWRDRLQREGICARASAESHPQVGRVESHGKTLKSMLTRMDAQHHITCDADFWQCLRAAVQG